jgi:hypothetical protein
MERLLASLAVVAAVTACAPVHVEELKVPVSVWDRENGLCGTVVALDGDGVVWREHGCENGSVNLTRGAAASSTQVADVRSAVGALPFGSQSDPVSCAGYRHAFTRRGSAAAAETTAVCGDFDDLASLAEPYRAAALSFAALP